MVERLGGAGGRYAVKHSFCKHGCAVLVNAARFKVNNVRNIFDLLNICKPLFRLDFATHCDFVRVANVVLSKRRRLAFFVYDMDDTASVAVNLLYGRVVFKRKFH